jgi:DNA-directed RNA polymerase subunit M/transcription elongation factor TFIIS
MMRGTDDDQRWPPMSPATRCPKCSSSDLLVVNLSPNGAPMQFTTCRHCENRWWEDVEVGIDIALRDVIQHIGS